MKRSFQAFVSTLVKTRGVFHLKAIGMARKSHGSFPCADDWDAARQQNIVTKDDRDRGASHNAMSVAQAAHWISLACYLEELDPRVLSLRPETITKVLGDIEKLVALGSLQGYLAAAECLSKRATDETDLR